jgi:small subunit ribosomal protein S11
MTPQAIVHVSSTYNNTLVTITDVDGNVRARTSAGACGFQGSRRSTRHAAQIAGTSVAKTCVKQGIRRVLVHVKGLGYGKFSCVRGLGKGGLTVLRIVDVTTIPFNGCRPPKRRRA